jgi:hypothetical protein
LFCTVAKNCWDSSAEALVIDARRVDVEDLLVEPPFGRADVADPFEQFIEVVGGTWTGRVLEPLVVHREALDQVLGQAGGRPLAKLRASRTAHAVANSDDGVEVVELDLARNRSLSFGSNYSIASNSCLRQQLVLGVDLLQVVVHRSDADIE